MFPNAIKKNTRALQLQFSILNKFLVNIANFIIKISIIVVKI